MKRVATLILLLLVPLALLLVAVQSGRYYALVAEARRLERVQADWIEENRKLLANIAVAGSRERVATSMEDAEGYKLVDPSATLRILVVPGGESGNATEGGGF